MSSLRITQVRSTIGRTRDQRDMVRTLGLKRIRHTVTQPDGPEVRGILNRIPHLVEWELVDHDEAPAAEQDEAPAAEQDEATAADQDEATAADEETAATDDTTTAAPGADDSES